MEVYRLVRESFGLSLSGIGSSIMGARWNSAGTELIYTATNRSLAMAEVAVHLTVATLPDDYFMLTIFIPDNTSIKKLTLKDLPENWNKFPHLRSSQQVGDLFKIAGKYCLLLIPSAVTKGDYNLLINPNHSEFSKIKIIEMDKFPFDSRIFK